MTKKDFEFWAEFIKNLSPNYDLMHTSVMYGANRFKITTKHHLAYKMAQKFAPINILFNAKKFFKACGFDTETTECLLNTTQIQD